nr:millepattes peptide 1 [Nasonia vitripennis]
MAVQLDPTGVY